MGATFTAAQWKELETQAMIYKYMVASLPVPYQLLLPIIQNQIPPLSLGNRKQQQLDDVQVGRCKRTDGKKWRCSRDVAAPNQKYCERHMHRGRPRSRKHVEQQLSKNKLIVGSTTTTILPSSSPIPIPFFPHHHNMQSNKRGRSDWSREGGSGSILNNNEFKWEDDEFKDYGRGSSSCGVDLSRREVLNPLAEVFSSSCPPYPTDTTGGDGVVSPSPSPSPRRMLLSDAPTTTLPFQ